MFKIPTQFTVNIWVVTLAGEAVIAAHFYQMWRDNSIPIGAIAPDWQSKIYHFGRPVYSRLGFADNDVMRRSLM